MLAEILNIFRGSDGSNRIANTHSQTQLDRVLASIEGQTAKIANNLSMADLARKQSPKV